MLFLGSRPGAAGAPEISRPPYLTQKEYCWCFCRDQELIAVTPTRWPPNWRNCRAMSGKQCQNPTTNGIFLLNCNGDTIVQAER